MTDLPRFIAELVNNWPWLCVFFAFGLGAIIGSLVNVCIYRMPLEKSILWPGSRCGSCLSKIRFFPDNIPIFSYWWLGGKCRVCGARFSPRYFWIEFLVGFVFALLFYLLVILEAERLDRSDLWIRDIGGLWDKRRVQAQTWQLLLVWLYHAAFAALLIVATFTDIDHWEIPYAITIPGTIIAIVFGTLGPWPWPIDPEAVSNLIPGWDRGRLVFGGLGLIEESVHLVPSGMQRWPVFLPAPEWLRSGTWQMGLATSLVGAAVGNLGMRLIRVIFSWGLKKEAMGLGDADLMMMIGAFLGWQALIFVLGFGVALGLLYAIVLVVRNQGNELPFGPFLAGGALLALLTPWWVYYLLQRFFFDLPLVLVLGGLSAVLALCLTLSIRMAKLIWEAV